MHTDEGFYLLDEEETDPRHDDIATIEAIQAVDPWQSNFNRRYMLCWR